MTQKLILTIREKGHTVQLPGKPQVRTPVEIDVTQIPLNSLILIMKNYNINDYEIMSFADDRKVIYKKENKKNKQDDSQIKDYIKSLNKRFNRMENLLASLFNQSSKIEHDPDKEQIKNKLERIEKLVTDMPAVKEETKHTKRDDYETEPKTGMFIPKIETDGMILKSSEDHTEIKRDEDIDEAADLLSMITKKPEAEE